MNKIYQPAVKVEGLWKEYIIGAPERPNDTFRDVLAKALIAPFRRFVRDGRESSEEAFWALRDVNFEIQPGEVVGIIGRNGAGKSTLLKILSRITEPTRGTVSIRGRVSSLLEVGTGFHPELTGRENIFLNGAILGMSRSEVASRFDEIVAFAEIDRFVDTPVKHYSSGMYVRLAFAVAAHLEPDILLVDEVLAVGDISFQRKCLGQMGRVARAGRTVVLVSHNMAAIQSLCTKGALLEAGSLICAGPLREVVAAYHESLSEHRSRSHRTLGDVQLEGSRRVGSASEHVTPESTVVVATELTTAETLSKCYLNFVVEDPEGRYLIHSRTDLLNQWPVFDAGHHTITIRIRRLGLRSGTYSMWFRLHAVRQGASITADSESVPLDVHGPQISGLADVPCEWSWDRNFQTHGDR